MGKQKHKQRQWKQKRWTPENINIVHEDDEEFVYEQVGQSDTWLARSKKTGKITHYFKPDGVYLKCKACHCDHLVATETLNSLNKWMYENKVPHIKLFCVDGKGHAMPLDILPEGHIVDQIGKMTLHVIEEEMVLDAN